MADLIDRDAFFKMFGLKNPAMHTSPDYARGWNALYSLIAQMKPVDAEPVRHGRWIKGPYACGEFLFTCSECGHQEFHTSDPTKWCSGCGAKMDKPEPEKTCDTCVYGDEPKTEQPCCGCVDCCNWEAGE